MKQTPETVELERLLNRELSHGRHVLCDSWPADMNANLASRGQQEGLVVQGFLLDAIDLTHL